MPNSRPASNTARATRPSAATAARSPPLQTGTSTALVPFAHFQARVTVGNINASSIGDLQSRWLALRDPKSRVCAVLLFCLDFNRALYLLRRITESPFLAEVSKIYITISSNDNFRQIPPAMRLAVYETFGDALERTIKLYPEVQPLYSLALKAYGMPITPQTGRNLLVLLRRFCANTEVGHADLHKVLVRLVNMLFSPENHRETETRPLVKSMVCFESSSSLEGDLRQYLGTMMKSYGLNPAWPYKGFGKAEN